MSEIKNNIVSIIVPVRDEEENIENLFGEICGAMPQFPDWECIWVDDGSTDGTLGKLKSLMSQNAHVRILEHSKSFGQSAALASGFRAAHGAVIVTLDGDGQNDPASIPALIDTLRSGDFDMVNGWREKRHDNIIRKLSSKIANSFRNFMTGEKIRDIGCALRAVKKEAVMDIPVFKGMHRFLPTLVRIAGHGKITEIPVRHRPRIKGQTKYGVSNRLWVGIYDIFAVIWMKSRLVFPKLKG
jgi:glycosyltransferase involved in cell wall biosynthesis